MSEIKSYILKNSLIEVSILNIGAALHRLVYKNANRVLSYKNLEDYRKNDICLGAMVGRVAGRISNAEFTLNNKKYKLDNNESDYCIHGGYDNLTKRIWDIKKYNPNDINPYVVLTTILEDGASGFPGRLEVSVKYILISSTVRIEIFAKSDKDTIVNITNHSYFNLNSDHNVAIKNHEVLVNADKFLIGDDNCTPIGIGEVEGSDLDFTSVKSLSLLDNLQSEQTIKYNGIDHSFILNGKVPNVLVSNDEVSLKINTTYPCMVVYSGNFISDNEEFETSKGYPHQGICFEAQYESDFINKDFLPNYILKKDEDFMQVIELDFK